MSIVTIETGSGEGHTARVDPQGRLLTSATLDGVDVPLVTQPAPTLVATSTPTAANGSSDQIVAAREGRRWLEIQNLGTENVHVLPGGGTATLSHRRIAPGEAYVLGAGVAFEGAVQAIADGADCDLVVTELYVD